LSGLSGGQFDYPLLDEAFICGFRVKRLIQRDIGLAQTSVSHLAFVFVLFNDQANSLALFGRQAELFDWIGSAGWIRNLRLKGTEQIRTKSAAKIFAIRNFIFTSSMITR
jgi:hypothetical protein